MGLNLREEKIPPMRKPYMLAAGGWKT